MEGPPVRRDAGAPPGWTALAIGGRFVALNGPLYGRRDGGDLLMGFRVAEGHVNPIGVCHGGMLMSFADMLLPVAALKQSDLGDRFLPTVSLSADFLAPAMLGAWVEGRARVLRKTRNLVFVEALATADGVPILRTNGIFKIGRSMPLGRMPDL